MRTLIIIAVSVLIVGGFLVYMSSYTVGFTQAAVVTTFGEVGKHGVVKDEGFHLKWPSPIQNVTLYDKRARFLQAKSETQQTSDDRQIVVETFLTWRVDDPELFYKRFRSGSNVRDHYAQAEGQLNSLLRSAMSAVSNYALSELFAPGPGQSKLGQLEKNIHDRLTTNGSSSPSEFGIDVMLVGINSVVLPEDTTKQVFDRMKESRKRLAAKAESEGEALATAIRSAAENSAARIREFAQLRASQIRARGDIEASQYLKTLNEDPELANFLAFLDLMRDGFGQKVTMILPTSMPGMGLFAPQAAEQIRRGELPFDSDAATRTVPTHTTDSPPTDSKVLTAQGGNK